MTSERAVNVLQGEFAVCNEPNTYLTTVLGSCVAVCLWDPRAGVGGLNHFLLPGVNSPGADSRRYGAHAMELLVNALLKKGADKSRLKAKVFGGARMNHGLRDIGGDNADFAVGFLTDDGITIEASDLRGRNARRIRFWPTSGLVKVRHVENHTEPVVMPSRPSRDDLASEKTSAITLF